MDPEGFSIQTDGPFRFRMKISDRGNVSPAWIQCCMFEPEYKSDHPQAILAASSEAETSRDNDTDNLQNLK